ncbi:aldo/keto reductase [Streptomyces sp. NPDC046876]|uniref:aldo/keto reductase n=1 Tax=Streptomyces sp. NPDC046876 TaxID=3155616 RepID=UPI0033EE0066
MTKDANASTGRPLYGCMGLGGTWGPEPYGAPEIATAEAAVTAALEIGITAFDHADIYRHGKSEAVFGELLARDPGLRARITLQTKCGIRLADGAHPGMYDLRGKSVLRRVEESLVRLRTDVIDVLLLHRPDPLADPDDIAEALHSLHAQGLVRRFGVSNMGAAQIAALQSRLGLPLVANQLEMSLHKRDWVEAGVLLNTPEGAANGFPHGTLEHCRDQGIQVQAWGALAQGRFTGRPATAEDQAAAELLAALAERKQVAPETVLLWWLQRHPAGIAPVIGTSDPGRIRACREAGGGGAAGGPDAWLRRWGGARGTARPVAGAPRS